MRLPIVAIVLLCPFVLAIPAHAQMGGGITTFVTDSNIPALRAEGKTYDISASVLDVGSSLDLMTGDMVRFQSQGDLFYVLLTGVSDGVATLAHGRYSEYAAGKPATGTLTMRAGQGQVLNVVSGDSSQLMEVKIVHVDTAVGISLKNLKTTPELAEGKALFDVTVDLNKDTVQSASDLTAIVHFVNFGEGPTLINITYLVKDADGKEYYRGVDSKIVYTEEATVKNFDFLSLPPGVYSMTGMITYGQNQYAASIKSFTVADTSWQSFALSAIALVALVGLGIYFRRKTHH